MMCLNAFFVVVHNVFLFSLSFLTLLSLSIIVLDLRLWPLHYI